MLWGWKYILTYIWSWLANPCRPLLRPAPPLFSDFGKFSFLTLPPVNPLKLLFRTCAQLLLHSIPFKTSPPLINFAIFLLCYNCIATAYCRLYMSHPTNQPSTRPGKARPSLHTYIRCHISQLFHMQFHISTLISHIPSKSWYEGRLYSLLYNEITKVLTTLLEHLL